MSKASFYLGFNLAMLVVILILMFIYLKKEKIDSVENKIYKVLIISSVIELFFEIGCHFGVQHPNSIFWTIVMRGYIVTIMIWVLIFNIYVSLVNVNRKKHEKISLEKYTKTNVKRTFIFGGIVSTIIMLIPINIYWDGFSAYTYGGSIDYVLIPLGGLFLTLWIVKCIVNHKKVKLSPKKYVPIIVCIISLVVATILQVIDRANLVITIMHTIVTFIMYHTIENPDLRMIEALDVAKEQADKANRAKTDFLSSMSHEIRTPLNAIVGFSDYIMSADTLDEAKENAKDIVSASNTLLEIVNGILDISKIEAGKLEIINSKYNARQTFESLAKLITPKMKEKGLDFTYYIAPDLPDTLFGDHANLKKIVTNLLSNAYKYTEKGSVRYEVNCINSNNISKLIITVEDTGRGIKQDSIDKLFKKFQRLDEDKNTTIEGTGLGLAITKQLIELMGGKILVHTVYGEGSKFTVVLNQHIEKTEIIEQKVEIKTTLDLKNKEILLVDDNSLNIKVANKILERFNADNITSLDNGFDCIELIKSGKKFDIILMDDMMPKMSGVETFHKLKEIEGFNQPVVILTANAITGMKEKYLKEGFDDYLAKPIEKDELIRVCNTIFQKYKNDQPEPPEENKIEEVQTIEEIQPIEKIEHIEELEIIGEEEIVETPKEKYLKENGVNLNKSLELLGDIEMYNMTITDFLSEVEEKWNNIITYKNNSDMENYAIEVHSLKSDAKYLGFTSLADIAYQHELKSKENDNDFVEEHFSELEKEYNKVLDIAKTYNKM